MSRVARTDPGHSAPGIQAGAGLGKQPVRVWSGRSRGVGRQRRGACGRNQTRTRTCKARPDQGAGRLDRSATAAGPIGLAGDYPLGNFGDLVQPELDGQSSRTSPAHDRNGGPVQPARSVAPDQTSSQLIDIATSPAPARMKQLPQDQHGWVGQRPSHHLDLPPVGLHGAAPAEFIHDL